MNLNHAETDIEKFKNLLSPIKHLVGLLEIIEKNRIDKEYKHSILEVEIPETLKICDENKLKIFELAASIDTHLLTYLEQCYELNDSLLDSSRIDHIYEMNQYQNEVLFPIMEILVMAEAKENQRLVISSLFEYYLFKDSSIEDIEREKLLKKQIEEFLPRIKDILEIVH